MIQDDAPKIYGIETIDKTSTVYVTEGPFDSHSYAIRLLCVELMVISASGGLAILFGFMIMNHRNKEIVESNLQIQSIEATP